jgi:hypothetical protein
MFKRLGWEHLGGSAFRYPPLSSPVRLEDWFNSVVPALMVFRAYALKHDANVTKFSIDAQTSTGFRGSKSVGRPKRAAEIVADATPATFGKKNLVTLLDNFQWPY